MKQPSRLPLSGITVISLEQAIAAPLASRHLADWGARVIKIERPGKGDFCRDYDFVMNGMSSQFAWTNRSKQSLALDVKSSEGKRVLDVLLPQADVFLQNLAPGAAKRLGLDAAALVERFPRLIACDISGYGSGGPYSEKKPTTCWFSAKPDSCRSTAPRNSRPNAESRWSTLQPACMS
jgi:crotonobetainyl-CoA:carnitine CoA-transferase CaiB-like acyl-CoA transferase